MHNSSDLDQNATEHPADIHLPAPSIWPAALAAGIALLLVGVILSLVFSVAGLVLMAIAVAGWIREIDDGH